MKMIALFITINLLARCCIAQIYIAPIIGYQADLNNSGNFKQINSGVQFSLQLKRTARYEFMLELQKDWALPYHSVDSSFSANPALPIYANAKKTIRPASYSFTVGHRISIFGAHARNVFSILVYGGMSYQKIGVAYQYDKNNYTILNPDETVERVGLFLKGGLEYMRVLKNGRVFVQLTAATPPLSKDISYPVSFKLMAPLAFNAGYCFPIKTNKHAKK